MADAHKKNRRGGTAVAAVLVAVSLSLSGCTDSRPDFVSGVDRPDLASGVDPRAVLEAFKSRGMVDHLEALERVADANGGNRASGTSGYEESARYVEEQLRAAGYSPVRQTFTYRRDGDGDSKGQQVKTFNILADTEGSPDHTVVVGGHLDSVPGGPGINDNASGVAAVLETALWMAETGIKPANRVRFAFWGAEEETLDGSQHYIDELSASEIRQTALNLNADMIASPNGVRAVNDGDGSDFGSGGPDGSKEIEALFFRYFQDNSLPAETTPLDGESDYEPFMAAGIPIGGLFAGDGEPKTTNQVQSFGGVADAALDPCYHQRCDTSGNVSPELLKEMSGALAYATVTFALAPRS
jgi:aminopeptidase S